MADLLFVPSFLRHLGVCPRWLCCMDYINRLFNWVWAMGNPKRRLMGSKNEVQVFTFLSIPLKAPLGLAVRLDQGPLLFPR